MPALSNVALTDTLDAWRVRTNQVIVKGNQEEIKVTDAYDKANSANLLAYNTGVGANTYLLATIAGANSVVGTSANAFTSATVSGANTIAIAAFDKANAALSNSTTTYVGTLTVVGNTTSNTTITNSDVQVGGISVNMPSGTIIQFGSNTAPPGTLECDGSALSRNTYSRLFSSINTLWGAGNGNTTFNIPDFRGNFARGWDHGANVDIGRAFANTQIDAMQTHTHSTPSGAYAGNPYGSAFASVAAYDYDPSTTGAPTGRTATETRPRNLAILFCIKY